MNFVIPIRTPSVANQRQHWRVKAKQVASQRKAAMLKCPKWVGLPLLEIQLTRFGLRELDSDNLASAMKGIRDGIAARLGIDDGSRLVNWTYCQARAEDGKERVEVDIHSAPGLTRTS